MGASSSEVPDSGAGRNIVRSARSVRSRRVRHRLHGESRSSRRRLQALGTAPVLKYRETTGRAFFEFQVSPSCASISCSAHRMVLGIAPLPPTRYCRYVSASNLLISIIILSAEPTHCKYSSECAALTSSKCLPPGIRQITKEYASSASKERRKSRCEAIRLLRGWCGLPQAAT